MTGNAAVTLRSVHPARHSVPFPLVETLHVRRLPRHEFILTEISLNQLGLSKDVKNTARRQFKRLLQ